MFSIIATRSYVKRNIMAIIRKIDRLLWTIEFGCIMLETHLDAKESCTIN